MSELLTASQIAKELDEKLHRVRYVIDYYQIEPVDRAGNVRLFSLTQRDYIKQLLYNLQIQNHH